MQKSRKYLKAEDLLAALLDAGAEILTERGVEAGLRVSLKEAIERAGVPRSSVFALLSDDGASAVEQFHRLLLERLEIPKDRSATMAVVDEVLVEQTERFESGDPVLLALALRELVRRGIHANVLETAKRIEWRVFIASLAAAGTGSRDSALLQMHREAAVTHADNFLDLYVMIFDAVGIRIVESMALEAFAASAANMTDLVALRLEIDPRLSNIERPTGADGSLQLWDAAAIAVEGLLLTWTEPDPAKEVSAALSIWTRYDRWSERPT